MLKASFDEFSRGFRAEGSGGSVGSSEPSVVRTESRDVESNADLEALRDSVAQIRIEVASLQELMTKVRDSFGLSPNQVLARELGPKWEAIAAFIKDFNVGDTRKYLPMKPADALARFGAPTSINSEYWTWRRDDAEIVPVVFAIRIRFREVEGAAEVEMTK